MSLSIRSFFDVTMFAKYMTCILTVRLNDHDTSLDYQLVQTLNIDTVEALVIYLPTSDKQTGSFHATRYASIDFNFAGVVSIFEAILNKESDEAVKEAVSRLI